MAQLIYLLCALTSASCTFLLLRSYTRTRSRLLFWSGLCFLGLTLNNGLVILDRIVLPDIDFSTWRLFTVLCSMLLLLFGLIWNDE